MHLHVFAAIGLLASQVKSMPTQKYEINPLSLQNTEKRFDPLLLGSHHDRHHQEHPHSSATKPSVFEHDDDARAESPILVKSAANPRLQALGQFIKQVDTVYPASAPKNKEELEANLREKTVLAQQEAAKRPSSLSIFGPSSWKAIRTQEESVERYNRLPTLSAWKNLDRSKSM
jgi:hypothetical protein